MERKNYPLHDYHQTNGKNKRKKAERADYYEKQVTDTKNKQQDSEGVMQWDKDNGIRTTR